MQAEVAENGLAMLHNSSLKDTVSKLILKAACSKCKEIWGIMARPSSRDTLDLA
jgi:hypothetical protein